MANKKYNLIGRNADIDAGVWDIRKKVIGIIREASTVVGYRLPRVEVRVVVDSECADAIAMARMGGCVVNVVLDHVENMSYLDLRHVVFHELVHAVFNIGHNEECALMRSTLKKTTKRQQNKIFSQYANGGV